MAEVLSGGDDGPVPTVPGFLAGGPGRVPAGTPSTPGTVEFSADGGVTWRPERLGR